MKNPAPKRGENKQKQHNDSKMRRKLDQPMNYKSQKMKNPGKMNEMKNPENINEKFGTK
jgi:hypothetical protein